MDEQQASAEEGATEGSAAPEKAAPDAAADITEQHKQLLDKHAQLGREAKAASEARVKAEARVAELEAEREKTRYEQMSDEQKAQYRREQEVVRAEQPKTQNLRNEKDLLRVIAETDDPKITKALSSLYWRSEARGKFPDKEDVLAFVDGLIPDEDEAEEEEPKAEKKPPKVTAVAGTRGKEPTADDLVKAAEASVKAKDGKFSYGELLGLRAEAKRQSGLAGKG